MLLSAFVAAPLIGRITRRLAERLATCATADVAASVTPQRLVPFTRLDFGLFFTALEPKTLPTHDSPPIALYKLKQKQSLITLITSSTPPGKLGGSSSRHDYEEPALSAPSSHVRFRHVGFKKLNQTDYWVLLTFAFSFQTSLDIFIQHSSPSTSTSTTQSHIQSFPTETSRRWNTNSLRATVRATTVSFMLLSINVDAIIVLRPYHLKMRLKMLIP